MSLDFLHFVEAELDRIAEKWEKRKGQLGY
jgi:hypothetical protein